MTRLAKHWASMALIVAAVSSAEAGGPAYMVQDIRAQQGPIDLFGVFPEFVEHQGFVYFNANDGIHGEEPWRWSPATGAEMIRDICPGQCWSRPHEFVSWNGLLFFRALDGAHRSNLWRTDGTSKGTIIVAPSHDFAAWFLTAVGDRLFFSGQAPGSDLWVTDGTDSGTLRLTDAGISPLSSIAWQGRLYFTADDGVTGRELWRSDGTPEGTQLVVDHCSGPADCFWWDQWSPWGRSVLQVLDDRLLVRPGQGGPSSLAVFNSDLGQIEPLVHEVSGPRGGLPQLGDAVLFEACTPSYEDCELWRSDGTAAGTFRVKDIQPGDASSYPDLLGVADELAYFYAYDNALGSELWVTDGTAVGTRFVEDINPGPASSRVFVLSPGVTAGERLLFAADDGTHGLELWATDGSAAGTRLLVDMNPGPSGGLGDARTFATSLTALAGEVILLALEDEADLLLWRSDGTPSGTRLVGDLDTQSSSMQLLLIHGPVLRSGVVGESLVFGADDAVHGAEPWITDGSDAGTELLADLVPGVDEFGEPLSSRPWDFAEVGGRALVGAVAGAWSIAGTQGETELLAEGRSAWPISNRPRPGDPTGEAFFGTDEVDGSSPELMLTDGSTEGTHLVAVTNPSNVETRRRDIFFVFSDAETGTELWSSDGDPVSNELVRDINVGGGSSSPEMLAMRGPTLFFSADDGVHGRELWRSDGSVEGTELVLDIRAGAEGSNPGPTTWSGRAATTRRGVFFAADDGVVGEELWLSDGTGKGTRLVADIRDGDLSSQPSEIVAAGERVFFFANDGEHGRELWVSKVRPWATRMVRDVNLGADSSAPLSRASRIIAVDEGVYFGATDGEHGVELWRSDGTVTGTYLLQDINPGPGSSSPSNFTIAGGCLYFSATDGVHGFELWALPLPLREGRRCGSE